MKDIHDGKLNMDLTDEEVERLFAKAVEKDAPDLWGRIASGLDRALPETDAFSAAEQAPAADKAPAAGEDDGFTAVDETKDDGFTTVEALEPDAAVVNSRASRAEVVDFAAVAGEKSGGVRRAASKAPGNEQETAVLSAADREEAKKEEAELAEKARAAARETVRKEAVERAKAELPTTILRGSEVPEENKKDRKKVSGRKKHAMHVWIPAIAAAAVLLAAIPAISLFGRDKAEKKKNRNQAVIEESENAHQPSLSGGEKENFTYDASYEAAEEGGDNVKEETYDSAQNAQKQAKTEAATVAAVESVTEEAAAVEAATEAAQEDNNGESTGSAGGKNLPKLEDYINSQETILVSGVVEIDQSGRIGLKEYEFELVQSEGEKTGYGDVYISDELKEKLPVVLPVDDPDFQINLSKSSNIYTFSGTLEMDEEGNFSFHKVK